MTCRAQELLRFETNLIAYWLHHGLTQKQYDEGLVAGEYLFKITTFDSEQNIVINDVSLDTEIVRLSNEAKVMLPKGVSEEDVPVYSLKGVIQEGFDARMIPPGEIPKGYEISGFARKLKLVERNKFHEQYRDPKSRIIRSSLRSLRAQFSNEDIEALGMGREFDMSGKRDCRAELIAFEHQVKTLTIWDVAFR